MPAGSSGSDSERQPLLDDASKAKLVAYNDGVISVEEETPAVLIEEVVPAAGRGSDKTKSTFTIVRNVLLALLALGGLALFIKAFIEADDVEVCPACSTARTIPIK